MHFQQDLFLEWQWSIPSLNVLLWDFPLRRWFYCESYFLLAMRLSTAGLSMLHWVWTLISMFGLSSLHFPYLAWRLGRYICCFSFKMWRNMYTILSSVVLILFPLMSHIYCECGSISAASSGVHVANTIWKPSIAKILKHYYDNAPQLQPSTELKFENVPE